METPDFFHGAYAHQFTPEKRHSDSKTDHFLIDDLLDFPTDDAVDAGDPLDGAALAGTSTDSSTALDSCNSADPKFAGDVACRSFPDTQFSNDLCVPYDDLAELEWLSNVVEESFSCEDLQKLQLISGIKARPEPDYRPETHPFQPEPANRPTTNPIFNPDMTVPGKARTKRSRAAPCNWTSRLLVLSPTASGPSTAAAIATAVSSESESDIASTTAGKKPVKARPKKEVYDNPAHNSDGRKCLHCATDKTPQWRSGPMGPKTLCNACGVRYKSGRLVPEYRPAASPTFVLTKHSNSHRKVLELRRQKEMQRSHQHQQQYIHHHPNMMFDVPNDDYLIHQHIGPDYRRLI